MHSAKLNVIGIGTCMWNYIKLCTTLGVRMESVRIYVVGKICSQVKPVIKLGLNFFLEGQINKLKGNYVNKQKRYYFHSL